jgi:AraC-like DNA-binding protein
MTTEHNEPRSDTVRQANPFRRRVQNAVAAWIEGEWGRKEAMLAEAKRHGWTEARSTAFANITLTPELLAASLDNVSLSKLRRELHKIGAPSPGQLIREARLAYAKHLLVETRLMIREVRERAGYDNDKHFKDTFVREVGMTPTEYRRDSIKEGTEPT